MASFLYHYMQGHVYWEYIDCNKGGRSKSGINIAVLTSLPIVLPSVDEQREIVAILDAIDRKIDLHRRKRAVLDELFKALLHKLMTGEIRVADLDLSALDAERAAQGAG
ncbi:MAG: restriction endonuclease subunit S [Geminicoccaceae bacterium]|nr:restriction endonuclease subunit S [Geminicoccaceae bacterium]